MHPDYKDGHYHHDIALVILKTPLNYTGETNRKKKPLTHNHNNYHNHLYYNEFIIFCKKKNHSEGEISYKKSQDFGCKKK